MVREMQYMVGFASNGIHHLLMLVWINLNYRLFLSPSSVPDSTGKSETPESWRSISLWREAITDATQGRQWECISIWWRNRKAYMLGLDRRRKSNSPSNIRRGFMVVVTFGWAVRVTIVIEWQKGRVSKKKHMTLTFYFTGCETHSLSYLTQQPSRWWGRHYYSFLIAVVVVCSLVFNRGLRKRNSACFSQGHLSNGSKRSWTTACESGLLTSALC